MFCFECRLLIGSKSNRRTTECAVSAKELEVEGVGGLIPREEVDVAAGIGFCGDNGLASGRGVGGAIGVGEFNALVWIGGRSNEKLFGVGVL